MTISELKSYLDDIKDKTIICPTCICEMEGDMDTNLSIRSHFCPMCGGSKYIHVKIDQYKSMIRDKKIDKIIR